MMQLKLMRCPSTSGIQNVKRARSRPARHAFVGPGRLGHRAASQDVKHQARWIQCTDQNGLLQSSVCSIA